MSRAEAIAAAHAIWDGGGYLERLRALVAVPTESQMPDRLGELRRYCDDILGPMVRQIGFETVVLDNPDAGRGPVLLGSRIEDPGLPTVLVYGHGDVVRGEPQRWRKGLDPWLVTVEGDKVYGRGVVDNKGQHLIAIEALRAVLAARGRLGFNAKVLGRVDKASEGDSPDAG